MSFVKLWIHCVWGTKRKAPFLTQKNKDIIIQHIKDNAIKKDIYIDQINGHRDHIHCLISLKADQSLAKILQLIKGESSFWINKNKITSTKFEWADEYYAVSVSESQLNNVRDYIKRQSDHHKKKTWDEEYDEFIKEYNFNKIMG